MTERIKKQQRNFQGIVLTLGVLLLVFGGQVFTQHYSADTLPAYYENMIGVNLRNGRWVHYFFYSLLNAFHLSVYKNLYLTQTILIIVDVLAAWGLYRLFAPYAAKDRTGQILCYGSAVLLFVNMCYYEGWFWFPETGAGAAMTTALCYGGIILWCQGMYGSKVKAVLGGILCFLAINAYQLYLVPIIILGTGYIIMRSPKKMNRSDVLREAALLGLGVFSGVANLLILKMQVKLGIVPTADRTGSLSLELLTNNIKGVAESQSGIWWNLQGYMPDASLTIVLLVLVVILVFYFFTQIHEGLFRGGFVLLMAGCYAVIFVPVIMGTTLWLPPRTIYGVAVFIAMTFLLASQMDKPFLRTGAAAVLVALLLTSTIQIQRMGMETVASNRIDQQECLQLADAIENYEQQTGNTVEQLYLGNDSSVTYGYTDTTNFTHYDSNVRIFTLPQTAKYSLLYYTGRDWAVDTMSPEKKAELFGDGTNYQVLNLDEQLRFEGNSAYLLVY